MQDRYDTEETTSGDRRVNGHLMCMAHDCPLRASINQGGGWLCSYHAFADSSRWGTITGKLLSSPVRDARHALASLRLAISEGRAQDIPVLMSRTQRMLMNIGATSEDVRLRPQIDIHGEEFQEHPEHFANRMQSVLISVVVPEDKPRTKPRSEVRRLEQTVSIGEISSALDSMVEAA